MNNVDKMVRLANRFQRKLSKFADDAHIEGNVTIAEALFNGEANMNVFVKDFTNKVVNSATEIYKKTKAPADVALEMFIKFSIDAGSKTVKKEFVITPKQVELEVYNLFKNSYNTIFKTSFDSKFKEVEQLVKNGKITISSNCVVYDSRGG